MSPAEISKKLLAATVPAYLFGGSLMDAKVTSTSPEQLLFRFYDQRIEVFIFEVALTPKDNGETQVTSTFQTPRSGPAAGMDAFSRSPGFRNYIIAAMAEHIDATLTGRPFSQFNLKGDFSPSEYDVQKVIETADRITAESRATQARNIEEAYRAESDAVRQNGWENDVGDESDAGDESDTGKESDRGQESNSNDESDYGGW